MQRLAVDQPRMLKYMPPSVSHTIDGTITCHNITVHHYAISRDLARQLSWPVRSMNAQSPIYYMHYNVLRGFSRPLKTPIEIGTYGPVLLTQWDVATVFKAF
jgi:hypothetical protein